MSPARPRWAALLAVLALCWSGWAVAEPLRIATFNTELSRKGPGLLLRDLRAGKDGQIDAVLTVIAEARPDILLVQDFDHDPDGHALVALRDALRDRGLDYPHQFARAPNSGLRTGRDHDGDGRSDTPRDAQGYGRFTGYGGMALLSRHPIDTGGVRDYSDWVWRDLPGATLPRLDGALFPDAALYDIQRLASVGQWAVPIRLKTGAITVLAFHATPPVFDGPEDRNGLRNRDELRFWNLLLDGGLDGAAPPAPPFVLMGDANIDPQGGEGHHDAIRTLLTHPALQDPVPQRLDGAGATTVSWSQTGPLRVDYVLPDRSLRVTGAGVFWPDPARAPALAKAATQASRHRLVWVDIALP